jgi:hypothetical protein
MGEAYLYITSADESQLKGPIDFRALIVGLQELGILSDEDFEKGGHEQEVLAGPEAFRFFDPQFLWSGEDTLAGIAESREALECIGFFSLKAPVPIPVLTHDYPVFCPHCQRSIDAPFQESLSCYSFESFFEGVPLDHAAKCEFCHGTTTLADLLKPGELLHRRFYVEVNDACGVSRDISLLSTEACELLEKTFQGPLMLRYGCLT